jgi:hypothetical protein
MLICTVLVTVLFVVVSAKDFDTHTSRSFAEL